ncbi:class D sortase [Robertmurraya korlensis]|uniref:class D sortase n=1 Tax=Robertmurraya korlensis TaxID=519977 RepID=UPI00203DFEB5|nr:class D sortase [Robertmurraya korlensis]MCM3601429.1 class D sortase [Robertmurraya korlensis]
MKIKILAAGLLLVGVSLTAVNTYYYLQGISSVQQVKMEPSSSVQLAEVLSDKLWPKYEVKPSIGEKFGELYIPRLEQLFPIYEGTGKEVLRTGVGHYIRSALPGEENNTILSGHRDTVFRGLRHLKEDDELIVTTMEGTFTYKIDRIRIVKSDDATVMTPKPRATLTVTTCYPFYFLGNAPERYIISAKLINKQRA